MSALSRGAGPADAGASPGRESSGAARALPPPGSAAAWLLACRPATLGVALVPVLVGSACALRLGAARLAPALAALAGALLIQVGTNLANDVSDHARGADTTERLGPTRAVAAGLVAPRAMRLAAALAFGLAFVPGAYLASQAGWPVVVIGLASVTAGLAYTAGPFPLAYHGLGELFVFAFFGVVAVAGTGYVQAGQVPPLAPWAALPVGALACAILVVNNLRDRHTDERAGKRTLAVRLGRAASRLEYLALLATAWLVPLALWATGRLGAAALLPLLALPLAVAPLARVLRSDGRALNPALAGTARLLVAHGALWGLGLALAAGAP